jgi:hypothetical protein
MVELMEIVTESAEKTNGRSQSADAAAIVAGQPRNERRERDAIGTAAAIQASATAAPTAEAVERVVLAQSDPQS